MAYIGRQLARGENKLFDDISSSFNGSTTVFNLTVSSVATSTATAFQLFVSLGGVMQKPNTDFTTAGNQITFTTAPAAGLSCWIMMQGDTIDQAAIPDASVTPSKIAGSGDFAFPADVRLNDGDGSHYVGFQAPTTVSTNKIWTLPAADGSANQYLKTDGSGTLSWGSDSTSDPSKMPLAGGTFTGDVTFTGDASNGLWDKSASAFVANLTGNVTGNASGSAATVTGAAQSAITSVGTLTGLTVSGAVSTGDLTVLDPTPDLKLQDSNHTGNSTEHTIYFKDSTGANQMNIGSPSGEQHLRIKHNTTDLVKIQTDGKIGIGLTAPLLKLHVQDGAVSSATTPNSNCDACIEGTTSTGIQFLADSQIQLRFGSAGSTADGSIIYEHTNDVFRINYSNSGYLSFRDGTAETFRFTPNNELGIAGANYGTSGQVLTSGGSGAAVSWTTIVGGVSSDAQNNTVAGTNAGDSFTGTDAVSNSLFGKDAGTAITSGDQNTGMGHMALLAITTGEANTAFGYAALGVCQTGINNTAIGHTALNVTTSVSNTACGHEAGRHVTTGGNGCFIGKGAGFGTSGSASGGSNTAVGALALHTFSSGQYNTAVGQGACSSITVGTGNVAIGYKALQGPYEDDYNIAIGYEALKTTDQSPGSKMIFIGRQAGTAITNGSENIGIGDACCASLTHGQQNTTLGSGAGGSITDGNGNVCLGHLAGTAGQSPVGTIGSGNYNFVLGNNYIQNLYCADTSISSSDKRDKTDVADFTHGLSWVNKLKPVTYRWDKRSWYNVEDKDGKFVEYGTPDGSKKRPRQHIGFLAQDVLAIEQADGFASKKDDMLVVNLNEDDSAYGLKYERLVPVLVNAIKELSTEVNTLKTKVAALEAA